jgi:hypothetical protein
MNEKKLVLDEKKLVEELEKIFSTEEIYLWEIEQIKKFEIDAITKDGFFFFVFIKENIENDSWFGDILERYDALVEKLDPLYGTNEKSYHQYCIAKIGSTLTDICEDHFVRLKISESEMCKRIDTILYLNEYIEASDIAKGIEVPLQSTKEDLGSFFLYFKTCETKWIEMFQASKLSRFKLLVRTWKALNHREVYYPITTLSEEAIFDKSLVDKHFMNLTLNTLKNFSLNNEHTVDTEKIKKELETASFEIKKLLLDDTLELKPSLEKFYKWIKLEKKFVKELPSFPIANQSKKMPFEFTNNFDSVNETIVYEYFKKYLIDRDGMKEHLSEKELQNYLICAFQNQAPPTNKFIISNKSTNKKIRDIFHTFYTEIAGKPYGKQRAYARLLGEYFVGFETDKVLDNFSK